MSLPDVNIIADNGNMGQIVLFDDGTIGLVLTRTVVSKKLDLNRVYVLSGTTDLKKLGIEQDTNPLLHKELMAFCAIAGEGVELHLIVVGGATTLTQMHATAEDFPLKKLAGLAAGRTRLADISRNPPAEHSLTIENGLGTDVQAATQMARNVAESSLSQSAPSCLFLPTIGWNGDASNSCQSRQGSCNRVVAVLASDGKFGSNKLYSAAIGQVLGQTAKISVHQNLGRVRSGAIAGDDFLTNGKTPREHYGHRPQLDDAGYIFYHSFVGKNGYCLNGDAMVTAVSDDYYSLSSGRVIDKAMVIAYQTYIGDTLDNTQMDAKDGTIPTPVCKGYEANIIRMVNTGMAGEVSSFSTYTSPKQNVLANGRTDIARTIVPPATLRKITANLSLKNLA